MVEGETGGEGQQPKKGDRTREEQERTYSFGLERLDGLDMRADVVRNWFKFA